MSSAEALHTVQALSGDLLRSYVGELKSKYQVNSKVLLLQTPQFLFESFNLDVVRQRGVYAYPPNSLQCIAHTLSGRGLDIEIFDLNFELLRQVIYEGFDYRNWLDILDKFLQERKPSIIGVTSLTVYRDILEPSHPLCAVLQHLKGRDEHIIIVGGPTATNEYEDYLRQGLCHFVVTREGEDKISHLFDLFYEDQEHPPTRGIYFNFRGKITESAGGRRPVPLACNLVDTYRLLKVEEYYKVGSLNPFSRMAGQDKPYALFQLNRGCRANCKFCDVSKFMGRGVRHYPVEILFKEIEFLVREKGIRHFEVLDDDFLGNREAVRLLLAKMARLRREFGITWSANNGLVAASLSAEILDLMRDSGCLGFRIGIESGNEEILRKLRKPATLELLREKGRLLQGYPEMLTGANYILGLLGEETFSQMLDTFRFSCELNLDWSSFTTFQFTSKETARVEHLKSDGNKAADFIPAKDTATQEVTESEGILSGPGVFRLDGKLVPSAEQVKQVWFTFNLIRNYIGNKNLQPGGNPGKFTSWVEAVHVAYPQNPYMPLFAALGHLVQGNRELALLRVKEAAENLHSPYWAHRFEQFGLNELVDDFPRAPGEVYSRLDSLSKRFTPFYDREGPRGDCARGGA